MFGMASVAFPSLTRLGIENGLWCRCCENTLRQYDSLRLPTNVLRETVPPNLDPELVLLGFERRARSKASFSNHVKRCYGAQQLLSMKT